MQSFSRMREEIGSRLVTMISCIRILPVCFELPTTIPYMNIVRNTFAEGAVHTRHSTDDLPVTDERLYRCHILFVFALSINSAIDVPLHTCCFAKGSGKCVDLKIDCSCQSMLV